MVGRMEHGPILGGMLGMWVVGSFASLFLLGPCPASHACLNGHGHEHEYGHGAQSLQMSS